MSQIANNLQQIRRQLPAGIRLVAVSKFHPAEAVMEAYDAGQRVFGENRVQEMVAKAAELPCDIEWHLIGHLQTNKVRQAVPVASMIESVDSFKLLGLIEREAARIGKTIDVLLQLHVAKEQTKSGFSVEELLSTLVTEDLTAYAHVRFRGVMAMATLTDDTAEIEREFAIVSDTFDVLKEEFFDDSFDTISMGMSDDWRLALRHGATEVRIGSDIFGPRQY